MFDTVEKNGIVTLRRNRSQLAVMTDQANRRGMSPPVWMNIACACYVLDSSVPDVT